MELIDTHAHLTFDDLLVDVDAVLTRSTAAGVTEWITVGTDREHIDKVLDLANQHDRLWAALGYHPHYAKDITPADLEYLKQACDNEKVIAIGETGLDFHYNLSHQKNQHEIFRAQLQIAAETNLPVVVHSRNAFDDTVEILDEFAGKLKSVVIHCYSGDADQAKMLLDKGYYISFTGIVTFKNSEIARLAAAVVPLDRMMIETDCPYISPAPMRNQRPCEPALLVHTAKKIAEIKGIDIEKFASAIADTSKRFFGIE
jgi:TatD DNase family protein